MANTISVIALSFRQKRPCRLNLLGVAPFRAKQGGDLTASTLAYHWQAISAVFGPVDPHELRHFAGHHLYVTMGLPSRVVGAQLGDTPRMIEELHGHGDVGALEEIDRAIGDNVVPLRRAVGE